MALLESGNRRVFSYIDDHIVKLERELHKARCRVWILRSRNRSYSDAQQHLAELRQTKNEYLAEKRVVKVRNYIRDLLARGAVLRPSP